ncbi:MAG: hypothetical protein F6J97_19555 [Leptolyngbya sp. SIO4C1]|nr:hypothetical protein [Leptolyngbya sp. SIO4C1]
MSAPQILAAQAAEPTPNRESVRLLVIGSDCGINTIIYPLHHKGFAHGSEWSPLLPHDSGRFMRILTRYAMRP